MTQEIYVSRKGWVTAPACFPFFDGEEFQEVFVSRTRCENGDIYYNVYTWNVKGTRELCRVIPKGTEAICLWGLEEVPTDDASIQAILSVLGLASPSFINFGRLPRLREIKCCGTPDSEQCQNNATLWICTSIDGYTDDKRTACEKCTKLWKEDFAGCPFWPEPIPIDFF